MPLMVSAPEDKDFQPAPVGLHQAVCVDVVDLGLIENKMYNKLQPKIRLRWQIDEPMENGERFSVSKQYTASLAEKAHLRADLVSWRGRPFTNEELSGFDVETVIGANAMVNVIHAVSQKNGKTYANIASISPLMKGMPKMQPDNYIREKDRPGYKPPTGLVASAYTPLEESHQDDEDVPF